MMVSHDMKQLILFLIAVTLFACKKNNDPVADTSPKLALDSLQNISSDIPDAVYADLTFTNEQTGYAITHSRIMKTTDGGLHWNTVTLPATIPLKKIQFTSNQIGYIMGGDDKHGVLVKTTNAGQTWNIINLDMATEIPAGMFFISDNIGFITGKKLFSKTTDGGLTWTSLNTVGIGRFYDINFKNSREGMVTAEQGIYLKTTDAGMTWTENKLININYVSNLYFTGNKSLLESPPSSLIDVANNFTVSAKPAAAHKLLFITPQKCIGIGSHFDVGFYPYGDIFLTNDGWATTLHKTFTTSQATDFTAIAKMSEHKIMILGSGFDGTRMLVLKR